MVISLTGGRANRMSKIPIEFWLILCGVNFFTIFVGIFLQDSSLAILGLVNILFCGVGYNMKKKLDVDE